MRCRTVVRLSMVMMAVGSRSRVEWTGKRQQAHRGIGCYQPYDQDLRQCWTAQ